LDQAVEFLLERENKEYEKHHPGVKPSHENERIYIQKDHGGGPIYLEALTKSKIPS
jgi:hypothetical protein